MTKRKPPFADHPARAIPKLETIIMIVDTLYGDVEPSDHGEGREFALNLLYRAYNLGITHALGEMKTVNEVSAIVNRPRDRVQTLAVEIGAGTIIGRNRLYTPEDVRRIIERVNTDKRFVEHPIRPRRKQPA